MAKIKNAFCGGFVGLNSGEITDCYSDVTVHGKAVAAGFCGNNTGIIKNSYSTGCVKKAKVMGGFWAKDSGTITDCFYNMSKTKSKKLFDKKIGKLKNELTFEKTFNTLNWDFVNIWNCPKDGKKDVSIDSEAEQEEKFYRDELKPFLPTFIKKNFYTELQKLDDIIEISTPEELLSITKKINNGDKQFATAKFLLTKDINLKNKKWTPIGIDENNPFTGTFDGGGYRIYNFKVNDKDFEYVGLFGFIKNATIVNLGIECTIKKGKYRGALAGVNEGGKIDCCFATCDMDSDKFAGGLVGKNTGVISHSFVIGKIADGMTLLLPPLFFGFGTTATITAAIIIAIQVIPTTPTYPAIPIDAGATIIPGEKIDPKSDGNQVSFEFDKQIVFDNVDTGGIFKFKNPGDSNHKIVVELHLTDQEVINHFGTTCRTSEKQAEIETLSNYSPTTTRQIIASSGSIPPGYSLNDIKLEQLQDGTVLKAGQYKAIIYLVFYDIKTNERAMLNSQLPVLLTISN